MKKENKKEKSYWCQCYDVNQKIVEKNIGKADTKDVGMVCGKCGYKIFEEIKL